MDIHIHGNPERDSYSKNSCTFFVHVITSISKWYWYWCWHHVARRKLGHDQAVQFSWVVLSLVVRVYCSERPI